MAQFTIGVAGHIDHGKTSLVKSLTGKNTDNLKDEIKRGMTIDIGFAHLNENISLIDVPGHEKFIRNMVSGVCSIDLFILTIAADDGIMPQTIEHFEILKLLGIKKGIIVINKIDLVDQDWLDIVELDIMDFIKGTILDKAKIFKISTLASKGIQELKNELISISNNRQLKDDKNIFRMFIDRVFTKKGFGNVVTGTVNSGRIKLGDKLKLLPGNYNVKVRGLQTHDSPTDEIKYGDRGAINLHSIDKIKINRGSHLCENNYINVIKSAIIKIEMLTKTKSLVKHNQRVRVHLGTQEVMGRLLIIDNIDKTNLEKVAMIKFEKELVGCFLDRFIIRSYSPITTICGGVILDTDIPGKWKDNIEYGRKLFKNSKNESTLLKCIIDNNIFSPYTLDSLASKIGIKKETIIKILKNEKILYLENNNIKWIVTNNQLEKLKNSIINYISEFHKKNKYILGVNKEQISTYLNLSTDILETLLIELMKEQKINSNNDIYFDIDFKINLSKLQIERNKMIFKILDEEKFKSSNSKELADRLSCSEKEIIELLKIESSKENIIIINGSIFFTKKNIDYLIKKIEIYFQKNNVLNIKDFKEIANTTRKYAVPILEYLDKEKITYRIGNERKAY